MTSKKLGALLRAVPPATAVEPAEPPPAPAPSPAPVGAEPAPRKVARPTPAVEPEVPFQVLIPESVRKQIGHMTTDRGESLRAFTLKAFRKMGVDITDDQIKGKRGRRDA